MDDDARVAAKLQRDPLRARTLLEIPADHRRAREGKKLEAVVLGQRCGIRAAQGQHTQGFGGPPGVEDYPGELEGRNGRLRGRLLHNRAARGDCRSELVRREEQREVERGDSSYRADGEPLDHRLTALAARYRIEMQHLILK